MIISCIARMKQQESYSVIIQVLRGEVTDYIKYNGENSCREAGKLRQEGKEYIVKDGDIFHFLFNV